ncbi:SusC/RagA family TonB-linked outer membrane protein [uncultured Mucilaginibacter sp.]|uniref:SusC/RagA family TonB-linked outer membrane protein n=1 Tax=uncultured Mucilaginibacter sp. TaxID=797541 RepID=UPI0025FD7E11|nr:SusC/RagA family TonB-linked outer membrane protein [uncultured Mucilaginibacter sp.]
MKKILLKFFWVLCVLCSIGAYAQNQSVSGRVTGKDDGLPLAGVSVNVKGTNIGTQTNADGKFSINVPRNATLVITFIGYANQEVSANGNLNIALNPTLNQLNEVLVVSYGTANKNTFTGSTAQVNAADFEKRPITNVLSSVVGAGPGISTTVASGAPGSSPAIRIRGFGSINAGSGALIIVDGAVYDGTIATINPDDVEAVSVLKDAATTALYGSRAGNGVVQITTKKGKAGKPTLTFKANRGWLSRGLPEYDRVDAYQYYPLMWEAQRNAMVFSTSNPVPIDIANSIASGLTTSYNGNTYSGIKSNLGYNPFNVADNQIVGVDGKINPNASLLYPGDLDWAKEAAKGGKSRQNYNMTYSGGADKSDYFGSFGYTKEEGYLINSNLERYNGRLNVNTQPLKWFKTGMNLTGSYTKERFDNVGDGGTSVVNPFYISRFIAPIYPVYAHDANGGFILGQDGQPLFDFGTSRPFSQNRHTIFENLTDQQNLVRGAINSRAYATINFYKDLKLTTNIAFDLQDSHQRTYDNPIVGDGAPNARAYHDFWRTTSYTFNQLLEYSKNFGKHHIDALAGHENYAYKYNILSAAKGGFIVAGITELPNFATILGTPSSREDNSTIESYLSRLNYNFDEKYLLSASLRRDGNSKVAPDNRWQNFWSVGLGWNLHNEDFFKVSWLDQLKLRSSYGVLGNADIGLFPYQALYTLGRNNYTQPGFTQASLPNYDLKWETSKNFDIGIDFTAFTGRISGSVEYFNRVTDGLIFDVPISLANGGTTTSNNFTIPTNIGSMYNKGVELNLNAQAVRSKDFNYNVNLNLTHFKNQITKMPESSPLVQDGTKAYSAGHSRYDYYLREFYGVDPQTGAALYKTNATTANSRIIGQDTVTTQIGEANFRYVGKSSIPKVSGAMTHTVNYKNFSLNVQFTFQLGGTAYDTQYAQLMHSGNYGTALATDILNRWQKPGDITNVPRMEAGNLANLGGATSTRWLISASYFQLNAANLNYSLPKSLLTKVGVKNANIFVSGENLALFSARKGMNVSGTFNGTNDNTYNFSRIVSLGCNVSF